MIELMITATLGFIAGVLLESTLKNFLLKIEASLKATEKTVETTLEGTSTSALPTPPTPTTPTSASSETK